jgi:hypothetical protein
LGIAFDLGQSRQGRPIRMLWGMDRHALHLTISLAWTAAAFAAFLIVLFLL